MQCIVCNERPAVIHYAEVVDGHIKKLDLCEQCAIKKGLGAQLSFNMGDLLGGITDDATYENDTLSCPGCNMSLEEFRKCGRLGCNSCYDSFADSLNPMLEQIHRAVSHKGKEPCNIVSDNEIKESLKKMEAELKDAITNEDFEKAALLRDEIRKLKQKK